MSHEEINAPQRPERDHSGPQLTSPSLECLTDEERNELGDAVGDVLGSLRHPAGQVLFDMAMDKFVDLGAHMVGHGLQAMVWSAFQAAMIINGQPPHDVRGSFVTIEINGENLTEAHHAMADMAKQFVEGTLCGAHSAALNAWVEWCNSLEETDWTIYCNGIALLVQQAILIGRAEAVEGGEMGDAVLGGPSMQLKLPNQED